MLLLYYFNWSQNKKIGRLENITQVLVEVRKLWDMAGILTVMDSNLKKRMDLLLKAYQSIIKDSLANRHNKKAEQKHCNFTGISNFYSKNMSFNTIQQGFGNKYNG